MTEQATDKLAGMLSDAVDAVIEGVPGAVSAFSNVAQYLLDAISRAHFAQGITSLAVAFIAMIIVAVCLGVLCRAAEAVENVDKNRVARSIMESDRNIVAYDALCSTCVILVVFLIVALVGVGYGLPRIIAPDGYAAREILGMLNIGR